MRTPLSILSVRARFVPGSHGSDVPYRYGAENVTQDPRIAKEFFCVLIHFLAPMAHEDESNSGDAGPSMFSDLFRSEVRLLPMTIRDIARSRCHTIVIVLARQFHDVIKNATPCHSKPCALTSLCTSRRLRTRSAGVQKVASSAVTASD